MTMTTNNHPVTPGISSALDVPVTHGKKEGESALLPVVMKRNGTPASMCGAAFCSRVESTTVVIGVSLSCSFGLFGLSRLSG
jgi:hypothetical protein